MPNHPSAQKKQQALKKIQLSDHFTSSGILLFSLPAIGMQLVDNTYQVAGGFFISSYIGPFAFAAENLVFPVLVVLTGIQCAPGRPPADGGAEADQGSPAAAAVAGEREASGS